jgi:hypothetical protein
MRWNGNGGYADGLTEGDRMARCWRCEDGRRGICQRSPYNQQLHDRRSTLTRLGLRHGAIFIFSAQHLRIMSGVIVSNKKLTYKLNYGDVSNVISRSKYRLQISLIQ